MGVVGGNGWWCWWCWRCWRMVLVMLVLVVMITDDGAGGMAIVARVAPAPRLELLGLSQLLQGRGRGQARKRAQKKASPRPRPHPQKEEREELPPADDRHPVPPSASPIQAASPRLRPPGCVPRAASPEPALVPFGPIHHRLPLRPARPPSLLSRRQRARRKTADEAGDEGGEQGDQKQRLPPGCSSCLRAWHRRHLSPPRPLSRLPLSGLKRQ